MRKSESGNGCVFSVLYIDLILVILSCLLLICSLLIRMKLKRNSTLLLLFWTLTRSKKYHKGLLMAFVLSNICRHICRRKYCSGQRPSTNLYGTLWLDCSSITLLIASILNIFPGETLGRWTDRSSVGWRGWRLTSVSKGSNPVQLLRVLRDWGWQVILALDHFPSLRHHTYMRNLLRVQSYIVKKGVRLFASIKNTWSNRKEYDDIHLEHWIWLGQQLLDNISQAMKLVLNFSPK